MFRSSSFLLLSMCIVFASPILVYCSCTDVPSSIKTPCTRFAKYRWYYISHRGTCRKYKWDGCGEGEAPGFRKWSSCKQAHCACHLHPQEGPCRSFARGYYFDQEEKVIFPLSFLYQFHRKSIISNTK